MPKLQFIAFLSLLPILSATAQQPGNGEEWADRTVRKMTLDEKIGQLFMIAAYSNRDKEYEDRLERTIRQTHIGGLIFFQGDPTREVQLTNRYQKAAKYPLMIGLDAEHGVGWRLKTAMEFPLMGIVGAISDDSMAFRLGAAIARHCNEIGVHINFAPVADINSNARNPIIGTRSFGEDRENVRRKTEMYVRGSLSEGVLPVVKHFPGHGDTDTDSHLALPVINANRNRLDSIELYPFKQLIVSGLPAIMVGHLSVPAMDSTGRPASLSPAMVKGFLRGELHFTGLCFTDAMNMKGVTAGKERGEADVEALLAGNDVLLFPEDIAKSVAKIKRAIRDGILTEEAIDEKCRKILLAKFNYVLPQHLPLSTEKLWSRLNTPTDFALKQALYAQAITLIRNRDNLLPLTRLDTLRIASLNFGATAVNHFQTMLDRYAKVTHLTTSDKISDSELQQLVKRLDGYNCVIIYNSKASNRLSNHYGYSPTLTDLIRALKGKRVILCHPASPYGLDSYMNLPVDALLVTYEDHLYARQYAAQAVFGGIPVNGQLPVGITPDYPAGTGIATPKTRLGYTPPEMCHINASALDGIDTLCNEAIRIKATPGCQVLVAKNGYVIYNKAFGFNTYQRKTANHTENIYDIASVTKITATLPSVMRLFDEGRIVLDTAASEYYPALCGTDKERITLRELLTHTAGLKSFFPVFADAIDKSKLPGALFTTKPTKNNPKKLRDRLYFNPNYRFLDSTFARTPIPGYSSIAPGLYIFDGYRDTLENRLIFSELLPKKDYLYSDLSFILLQRVVESLTEQPLDRYCNEMFYKRLGAYNTEFKAAERLNTSLLVPSCVDDLYRKKELRGYVHDPTAAVLGGVAGHAGLFSTAGDLAKILSVYINGGCYGGERFFADTTVARFTQRADTTGRNRRGLGFDKPEPDTTKVGPTCTIAPLCSFGHTGFTGTMVWCDPDNRLIYIFLSNRTYPNEFNAKLSEENIRTRIQEVIYRALPSK